MEVDLVSRIFQAIGRAGLQVNLVQTTAVSLVLCVNLHPEAIAKFTANLMDEFNLSQSEPKVLTTRFPFSFDDLLEAKDSELVQVVGEKLFVVG